MKILVAIRIRVKTRNILVLKWCTAYKERAKAIAPLKPQNIIANWAFMLVYLAPSLLPNWNMRPTDTILATFTNNITNIY